MSKQNYRKVKTKRKPKRNSNTIKKTDPLNWWNKFWLVLMLGVIVVEMVGFPFFSEKFRFSSMFIFGISFQSIVISFQYRQLRKKVVFRSWLLIAFLFLGAYLLIKYLVTDADLYRLTPLLYPIGFMTTYSIFSKVAKAIYNTELGIPMRSTFSLMEESRKPNVFDYVAFFSYWITPITMRMFFG